MSVGARVMRFLLRLIDWLTSRVAGAFHQSPAVSWLVLAIAGALVLALVARVVMLARARTRRMTEPLGMSAILGDAWQLAAELAADGRFTDAAHALYVAVLDATARRASLRLHPSKTAGDYLRELREQPSPLVTLFRDFARAYDATIYGLGMCDRERFERLRLLAQPVVEPHG